MVQMRALVWGSPRQELPVLALSFRSLWENNIKEGQKGSQYSLVPDFTSASVISPCYALAHCFPLSIHWSEWEAIQWTLCAPVLKKKGEVLYSSALILKPSLDYYVKKRQGSHLSDDSELEFPSVGTLARDDTWTQELPCLWNCGGELSYCTESYRSEVPRGVPLIVNVSFSWSVRWNINALGSFYIKVWIEAIQGAEELERHE